MLDSFTATPAAPIPGQSVAIRIDVHDPDCSAGTCTSGCGALILPSALAFSDNTGRGAASFSGTVLSPMASPWSATTNWLAPAAEGTWTVNASVSDNGGSLCGGRKTAVFTLQVTVSSSRPPVIDSCVVSPSSVPAGGTATLTASASDPLGRPLTYTFSADAGSLLQTAPQSATWTAPQTAGTFVLRCRADAGGTVVVAQTTASVEIGAYEKTLETSGLSVTRVAPLPDGRLAVVDGVNGVLALLTRDGALVWKATGLGSPVAVTVTGAEIFALERRASKISVWSTAGQKMRELPLAVALPNQLVAGPGANELSVTDTDAAVVAVISAANGAPLRTLGRGILQHPAGLAVSSGRLAVADSGAAVVQVFSAEGVIEKTINSSSFVRPQGVAWDAGSGRLIVSDSFTGELNVIGEEGSQRGTLAGFGTSAGQLINPIDVALLPGNVLAVSTGGGSLPLYRLLSTVAPIQPPAGVTAADTIGDDGGSIAVTWSLSPDDPARVTGYRIERALGDEDAYQVIGTVERGIAAFVDAAAADGVCYRYRVAATDGSSDAVSAPSICAVAKNDLPPAPPQNLFGEADSPFAAWVEWDPVTAADLSGYRVEFTAAGDAKSAQTVDASLEIFGLIPDTQYLVSVRAADTAGNLSDPATFTLATWPDAAPPAPADVVVSDAATGGTVSVTWTAPSSSVPIAKYRVVCTPSAEGWESPAMETSSTQLTVTGLVNALTYAVTVSAVTPWDREGSPSGAQNVTPTAPQRALPMVAESNDTVDAAGVALSFGIAAEKRELRFQYRAAGTTLQILLDGAAVGAALADTGGLWADAAMPIEKKLLKIDTLHLLELRSTAFPQSSARLAVRRVDFVPLVPAGAMQEAFNTVADIVWRWEEWRPDLGVVLTRDGVEIPCRAPWLGRCRDPFLANQAKHLWTLAASSPAGWLSPSVEVQGRAVYEEAPPPVTDLTVTVLETGLQLDWTPLSTAPSKSAAPAAVASYRIYSAGALVGEVAAPPALIGLFDAASIAVKSVDAEGRESR